MKITLVRTEKRRKSQKQIDKPVTACKPPDKNPPVIAGSTKECSTVARLVANPLFGIDSKKDAAELRTSPPRMRVNIGRFIEIGRWCSMSLFLVCILVVPTGFIANDSA